MFNIIVFVSVATHRDCHHKREYRCVQVWGGELWKGSTVIFLGRQFRSTLTFTIPPLFLCAGLGCNGDTAVMEDA